MKKKTWLKLLIGAWGGFFAYSHLIEERSLSSLSIENLFRIINWNSYRKPPAEVLSKMLPQKAVANEYPVQNPEKYIKMPVKELFVNGMQTFVWNDQNDSKQKVIFYIHGGGYLEQPLPFHYFMVNRIAKKTNAKVVFPIYSKLPRNTFADAYPQIFHLYQETLKSVFSENQITLMGDSAGGGFALGLALLLKEKNLPQPKDIVLLSPWVNIATDNPDMIFYEKVDPALSAGQLQILGDLWAKGDLKNPLVSPIYGDFNNLGRISIFVGTHEIFYPDIAEFHQKLKKLGIVHNFIVGPKMDHVYVAYPIPEAKQAQNQIIKIILTPKI